MQCISASIPIFSVILVVLTMGSTQLARAQTYHEIYSFTGGLDGDEPEATVTIDQAGNLYGTTAYGGSGELGAVFKLTKGRSGWTFAPLYSFHGDDGANPTAPVTIGPDGSLYGTTSSGGDLQCDDGVGEGCGVVFNLRPGTTRPPALFTPWNESLLHTFVGPPSDGDYPYSGTLLFDQAGNLYGTTVLGGNGSGTVFQLAPSGSAWTYAILYTWGFRGQPAAGVIMDQAGNLYGTLTEGGACGNGAVYELTPSGSGWAGSVLYSFCGASDGLDPEGGVIFDAAGNLYGTTYFGGSNSEGVVYQLVPSGGEWALDVIYDFQGPTGSTAALAMDAAGNLYGTTIGGGYAGMVFKLTPDNGSWLFTDLHDFPAGSAGLYGGVTLDSNGNLFGTAAYGGAYGRGVVWEITP